MNCHDFEMMMAEALGGELPESRRGAFEKHLGECSCCRTEYEAGKVVIRGMQSIPAPPATLASDESHAEKAAPSLKIAAGTALGRAPAGRSLRLVPLLRHAAVIALAFVAGYAARGSFTSEPTGGVTQPIVQLSPDEMPADGRSFESTLTSVYRRRPAGSDLGKCMAALFRAG